MTCLNWVFSKKRRRSNWCGLKFLVAAAVWGVGELFAAPAWSFLPGGNAQAQWRLPSTGEVQWQKNGLYMHGPTALGIEINFPQGLDAKKFSIFNYKITSGEYGAAWLYFARGNEKFSNARRIIVRLKGFESPFEGSVNCRNHCLWRGKISRIRLNPLCRELDHSLIEELYFSDQPSGAVANGSFEIGAMKNSSLPQAWTFSDNSRAQLIDSSYHGQAALRLSGVNRAEQKIELKEQYPATLTLAHRLSQTGRVEIVYYDIFDQELERKSYELPASAQWQNFTANLHQPELTAFVQVALQSRGGIADFDAVKIMQPKPEKLKYQAWQASWIWDRKNAKSAGKPVLFRRSFQVNDPAQVPGMRLQVVTRNVGGIVPCDNVKVYINGRAVDPSYRVPKWTWSQVYNLKPGLIAGKNVVAIEVNNLMDPGALLAEILLDNSRPGHSQFIRVGTLPNWKVSDQKVPGWNLPSCNDAGWRNALLRGQPSPGSFHQIPYRYLGTAGNMVPHQINFPARIDAQKSCPVGVTLQVAPEAGQEAVTQDAKIYFHLIDQNFSSTAKLKAVKLTTCGLKLQGQQQLDLNLELNPRFLRNGNYTLRIYVDRLRLTQAPAGFTLNKDGNFLEKKVQVFNARQPGFAQVRLVDTLGLPRVQINGETYPWSGFEHGGHSQPNTERNLEIAEKMALKEHQIMDLQLGPPTWSYDANGNCDFSAWDSFLTSFLARHPDTYFNLHWSLDVGGTRGSMRQWLLKHPEVWAQDWRGSIQSGTYLTTNVVASMAAPAWQQVIVDATQKFVKFLQNSPYADRIIGVMPNCGISSEWMYWGSQAQSFMDYSQPFQQGFRKFIQKKYGTKSALSQAWQRPIKSWCEVKVPSKAARMKVRYTDFLEQKVQRPIADLREFLNLTVSNNVIAVLNAVKQSSDWRLLAGTYYGYNLYVTAPYLGPFSGHYALHRVIQCKALDYIASPCRYDDRAFGGAAGSMVTIASLRQHGKIWLNEADNRTLHAWCPSGKVYTLRESKSVIEREFAFSLASGSGQGWYDFGEGWLPDDTRLVQVFQNCQRISRQLVQACADGAGELGASPIGFDPANAIAVVTDEKAMRRAPYRQRLFLNLVGFYPHLFRTGAGVHWYLLEDLDKLTAYKCIVFAPTVTKFTAEQQNFINEKLKNNNRSLVWLYATGVYNNDQFAMSQAGEMAGVAVAVRRGYAKRALRRAGGDHPVLKYLPLNYTFGFSEATDFLVTPQVEDSHQVLMTTASGQPGLVELKHDNWTGYYCASPSLSAPLLRGIADKSGIRIFNSAPDVTYACRNFYAVHTILGGERTFNVPPETTSVKELLTRQVIPVENGRFSYTLQPKSTVMFQLFR